MLFVSLILLALSNFTLSHFVSWAHNVSHPTNDSIVSFDNLPTAFAGAVHLQNPADVEQIRNTLWLYPLAIDGKNFAALDLVFTQDVVANYSAPLNVLTPLSAVQAALQRSLMPVTTQHKLSTQVVEILPGGCQAKAVTYYDATHFGMGNYTGQVCLLPQYPRLPTPMLRVLCSLANVLDLQIVSAYGQSVYPNHILIRHCPVLVQHPEREGP